MLKNRPASMVALAIVAGLAVRLASIRNGLWLDELTTLWVSEGSIGQVIARSPQVNGMSPFFSLFAWGSLHAFGESELALRLPSLLAMAGCTALVANVAASLGGRRAAAWSAVLLWVSYPAVWESVNARPYALAWLFIALALLGFVGTCTSATRGARTMWVLGAAGVGWTQYVYLPFIGGLIASVAIDRRLRRAYPVRRLAADTLLITALLAPAWPQLATLFEGRQTLDWILSPRPLALVAPVVPFLLAALMPAARRLRTGVRPPLERALWAAVVAQVGTIAAAMIVGVNLTATRYVGGACVAVAVLAGVNLARLSRTDLLAPLTVFAVTTGLAYSATIRVCGSLSGAGYQQWREAVASVDQAVAREADAPVLFRSGNVQDDLLKAGTMTWPPRRAPLRSPGEHAPDWNIVPLTYRWASPGREIYFAEVVAPAIENRRTFYLLCLRSDEPGTSGYCRDVEVWVAQQWPERFRPESLGTFRQLTAMRFERTRPPRN